VKLLYILPKIATDEELDQQRRQIPEGLLDSDTIVEFRNVAFNGDSADSFYADAIMQTAVLEAGLNAEADGFDAVCIGGMNDVALFPLRSRLTIPVVGPGIVAFHVAGILAMRFSIITVWSKWEHFYRNNLAMYGLQHKLASIRNIGVGHVPGMFTGRDSRRYIDAVLEQARLAVKEDGAEALVIGSLSMTPVVPDLQAAVEVPVISPGLWSCKIAESLVKLRISHSKRAFQSPDTNLDALIHSFANGARSSQA
jgi:Asp/Glu/hydantoin racemase